MNLGGQSSAGAQERSQEAVSYALCSENLGLDRRYEHKLKDQIYKKYECKTIGELYCTEYAQECQQQCSISVDCTILKEKLLGIF